MDALNVFRLIAAAGWYQVAMESDSEAAKVRAAVMHEELLSQYEAA
jgi:hypothetical protein